jgi:hypothetical protein
MGRARAITVDGVRYLWARAHAHASDASGHRQCSETVRAWRREHRGAPLVVRFVDGESGGHTTAGDGWGGGDGLLLLGERWINLNRPAVVAALIRSARQSGWNASTDGPHVVADGFAFVLANPVPTGGGGD